MEHPRHAPDPENQHPPEHEPHPEEPYIVLHGGLIVNNPALPIIDLDLLDVDTLLEGDAAQARLMAQDAGRFGLTEIAEQFRLFADMAERYEASHPNGEEDEHGTE